jgi:hypothetical protein
MKKKGGKWAAFLLCFFAIIGMFVICCAIVWFERDGASFKDIPFGAFLTALGTLAGLYFTGQVANNGVTGAFYRSELDERKNIGGEK